MNRRATTPPADAIDCEHLDQTVATAGYALIAARLKAAIESEVQVLLSATDPSDVHRSQGVIKGMRLALSIPTIIQAEIREREAKKGRVG